jgi:hypothetical protein
MNRINAFQVVAVLLVAFSLSASAQQPDVPRIERLESQLQQVKANVAQQPDVARIEKLESRLRQVDTEVTSLKTEVIRLRSNVGKTAGSGASLFLFGVVCALWAQNTGRNPWLWFFLGLLFSVITGLVMLYKNSQDRKMVRTGT